MIRLIIFVIAVLVITVASAGCASGKKNYREKRGLMLLETTQLGRNKAYYSKHKAKKLNKDYRKIVKNRKYN